MKHSGLLLFVFLFAFFVIVIAFMPSIFGSLDATENSTIYNNTYNTTYQEPYNGIMGMVSGIDGWLVAMAILCVGGLFFGGIMYLTGVVR